MLDVDRESAFLDFVQPGCLEELREVPFVSARKLRLILDVRIQLPRRLPKQAERPLAASVIPNAGRHDTVLTHHARHFAKPPDGICHEVNDELCQRRVERLISKRELLRRGASHADPGVALSSCCNERLRRIDGRNGGRSQPPDQLCRECAGAAADIENSLTSGDRREIGELGGKRHRIPAHESVVGIGADGEAH